MELGHIVFSCTKWFTQLARKYKVSWNPWASFAWRRGCWWRIFANFSSEGWRCEWSSPVFFLAAHKQGYRITTLHMGNGWATCNPVYVQLFFLRDDGYAILCVFFLCEHWIMQCFFGGIQVFLTQCLDFFFEPAVLPLQNMVTTYQVGWKKTVLCCQSKADVFFQSMAMQFS